MDNQSFIGRRKTSTARVYVQPGKGEITVNNKPFETYFVLPSQQNTINLPMEVTETTGKYDIKITVRGGGSTGQADAAQLGIARALNTLEPETHGVLKSNDLLTRDDRMVERKKYGQPKARKKFQFSKR
ncbi:30S ribosomal protein S9 [Natronogracilivirga saccharolytica]|uniref:Small ribosomal subunit protein uS9 n=1 Tax=Natronogracilivirga saccharolytica TaxID=2812953 RepID=A0A8J7S4V1_9BACT|nr:30S ribosomal protein S9 [Natronogracilivirga saccharolytica]MBP3192013.1 30S ribosomal protein S9 [Natronogracilivirga saccharolytica]